MTMEPHVLMFLSEYIKVPLRNIDHEVMRVPTVGSTIVSKTSYSCNDEQAPA